MFIDKIIIMFGDNPSPFCQQNNNNNNNDIIMKLLQDINVGMKALKKRFDKHEQIHEIASVEEMPQYQIPFTAVEFNAMVNAKLPSYLETISNNYDWFKYLGYHFY